MIVQNGCTDDARLQPPQATEDDIDAQMNTNLWHEFDFAWESDVDECDSEVEDLSDEDSTDGSPETPRLNAKANQRLADLLRSDSFMLPDRREFRHSKIYREQSIVSYLEWVGSDPVEIHPAPVANENFKSLVVRRLDKDDDLSTLQFIRGVGELLAQRLMAEGKESSGDNKKNEAPARSKGSRKRKKSGKKKITLRMYLGYCLDKSLWYMKGWRIRKCKDGARRDSTVLQKGRPSSVRSLNSILKQVRRKSRQQAWESSEKAESTSSVEGVEEVLSPTSEKDDAICTESAQVIWEDDSPFDAPGSFYHHPGADVGERASTWGHFEEGLEATTPEPLSRPNGVLSLPELLSQAIPPNPPDTSRLPKFQGSLDNVGEVEEESEVSLPFSTRNLTAPQTLASVPEVSLQSPATEEQHREDLLHVELVQENKQVVEAAHSLPTDQTSSIQNLTNTSSATASRSTDMQAPLSPALYIIPNTLPASSVHPFGATPAIRQRITRLERFPGELPTLNIIRPHEYVMDPHLSAGSTGTDGSTNRRSEESSEGQKESQASSPGTEFEEDLESEGQSVKDDNVDEGRTERRAQV